MKQEDVGMVCEYLVRLRLKREGYVFAIPDGQQKGWDLIVEVEGKLQRWQVKAVQWGGKYGDLALVQVNKRTMRKGKRGSVSLTSDDDVGFDVLIIVDPGSEMMWKVPAHHVRGRWKVHLTAGRFEWIQGGELTGTAQIKLVED